MTDREPSPMMADKSILTALRFVPVATWISEPGSAVALNANGEVLIFHDKNLSFARPPRRWGCFAHETIVIPMATKAPVRVSISEVLEAVRGSWLDAPLAGRSGAMDAAQERDCPAEPVASSEDGALRREPVWKIGWLRKILGDKASLHDLDTQLRREIAALDGAVVLTLGEVTLAARSMLPVSNGLLCEIRSVAPTEPGGDGVTISLSEDDYMQVLAALNEGPFIAFG